MSNASFGYLKMQTNQKALSYFQPQYGLYTLGHAEFVS